MIDLCADIGFKTINHYGEQLCGDHIEIISPNDNSTVIVLSDGLGSGVKASILSTLTSKIISTMLAEEIAIEECVNTIVSALPVCSLRGVAYSTFTIIQIHNNNIAEIIEYDNPGVILIRNQKIFEFPRISMQIGNKNILKSLVKLEEHDIFVAMSDGCTHAGTGLAYNFGWKRSDIASFMEMLSLVGYTAKTLATMLVDECYKLYNEQPGDDASACVIKIRRREPLNILFGPPSNRDESNSMMSLFFSKGGKHIVCGGTTSSIAAKYLRQSIVPSMEFPDPEIPPIAKIKGVDLVTEGVITMNRVVEYAQDYLKENKKHEAWGHQKDGASLMARMLFEDATDINFYVGRAVNPAHQNPELPIAFNIKMNLVNELTALLTKMGKKIKVSYF